ncbi:MAG: transcriptional regulator [Oscillospiraceae bacterium]|nr:transcriptional regulator [Oscillospiraceae bacterium]
MANLYEVLSDLCAKNEITGYKMCKDIGIQPSIMTDLKMGRRSGVNADTAAKIADYFGVTVNYLLGKEEQKEVTPVLTKKDERDIARRLAATLEAMGGEQDALMFDGEPIDDETRELLEMSLRNTLELGKRLAKQKYSSKKSRERGAGNT